RHKEAGDAFLTGYTTYSSSNKAPDSLLKLGMSLNALGNKDAACTVWSELGSRFPQASPAVVARNKLEREKAGC
ncbi:MAG: tol-pal system protein YbgF, partial [Alphaproteobacteria bacterium HGW-Alphaproteobacteria-11]